MSVTVLTSLTKQMDSTITYLSTYFACPLSKTNLTKLSVIVPTSLTKQMDSTITYLSTYFACPSFR